jgi:hypothetical protein
LKTKENKSFCRTNAKFSAQDISKQIIFLPTHKNRKSVITDFFVGPRSTMVLSTNGRNYQNNRL